MQTLIAFPDRESVVHVIYNGGPIQLENVIFVDCVFEMKYGRNTQNLALAALVPSPATTFSAS